MSTDLEQHGALLLAMFEDAMPEPSYPSPNFHDLGDSFDVLVKVVCLLDVADGNYYPNLIILLP